MAIEPKQPTAKGPAEWFTGDVCIEPVVRATEPSRVNVSTVRSPLALAARGTPTLSARRCSSLTA